MSKSLYPLATKQLYHTIQIGREPQSENWRANLLECHEREESGEDWHYITWKLSRVLIRRLQENSAGQQARAVRVLEISGIQQYERDDDGEEEDQDEEQDEKRDEDEDEEVDEDGVLSESGQEKIFIALVNSLPCLDLVRYVPSISSL